MKRPYTKIYLAWVNMRQRCRNKNHPKFPRYGGRGIIICKEWESFAGFERDMSPTHNPKFTLERTNRDGPYCKANCIWADATTQANNTSRNIVIKVNEIKKTLPQWCRSVNLPIKVVYDRLFKLHWPVEIALKVPHLSNESRREYGFGMHPILSNRPQVIAQQVFSL